MLGRWGAWLRKDRSAARQAARTNLRPFDSTILASATPQHEVVASGLRDGPRERREKRQAGAGRGSRRAVRSCYDAPRRPIVEFRCCEANRLRLDSLPGSNRTAMCLPQAARREPRPALGRSIETRVPPWSVCPILLLRQPLLGGAMMKPSSTRNDQPVSEPSSSHSVSYGMVVGTTHKKRAGLSLRFSYQWATPGGM